jgi:hypothetical protein
MRDVTAKLQLRYAAHRRIFPCMTWGRWQHVLPGLLGTLYPAQVDTAALQEGPPWLATCCRRCTLAAVQEGTR